MAVNFVEPLRGSLQYIVNGMTLNKSIIRLTFRNNNLGGNYIGGLAAPATSCHGVTNGAASSQRRLLVTQTGQNVSMAVSFYNGAACRPSAPSPACSRRRAFSGRSPTARSAAS